MKKCGEKLKQFQKLVCVRLLGNSPWAPYDITILPTNVQTNINIKENNNTDATAISELDRCMQNYLSSKV